MDYTLISIIGLSTTAGFWFGWSVRSDTNWKTTTIDIEDNFKTFKTDVEENISSLSGKVDSFGENEVELIKNVQALQQKMNKIIKAKSLYSKINKTLEGDIQEKADLIKKLESQLPEVQVPNPESDDREEEKKDEFKPTPEQGKELQKVVDDLKKSVEKEKALEKLRKKNNNNQDKG